jgi:hypothetical protein
MCVCVCVCACVRACLAISLNIHHLRPLNPPFSTYSPPQPSVHASLRQVRPVQPARDARGLPLGPRSRDGAPGHVAALQRHAIHPLKAGEGTRHTLLITLSLLRIHEPRSHTHTLTLTHSLTHRFIIASLLFVSILRRWSTGTSSPKTSSWTTGGRSSSATLVGLVWKEGERTEEEGEEEWV